MAFTSGAVLYPYSDKMHALMSSDRQELETAEVVARRVSNINPVCSSAGIEFEIAWHPELVPMLGDDILARRFRTREAAEKFEVGIIADLLNMNSGRSALSRVCSSEAFALA